MSNLTLGDIVALESHPLFDSETEILIAADETLIPPTMVVIDILDSSSKNKERQFKCIYYSSTFHKYFKVWISESQIKKIKQTNNNFFNYDELNERMIDKSVILKNWNIEIKKRKSSLIYDSQSSRNTRISAFLTFLPPVMKVIGSKIDKSISKHVLKCKWYNPKSNTYSEDYFTLESLQLIKPIDENLVFLLDNIIRRKKYVCFKNIEIKYNDGLTIGKPISLTFNHCFYILTYFDYLTNKTESVDLINFQVSDFEEKESYFITKIPLYSEFEISKDVEEFLTEEFLNLDSVSDQVYRINYTNIINENTTRTIGSAKMIYNGNQKELTEGAGSFDKKYLEAICFLREGEKRNFKFTRINNLEILNVERMPTSKTTSL
ncbi:hypothetical protein [Flavobacterium sp.]|uniref:hypothetical protein n=1 Tax=Flavobacterium sp. TaxID=239 RepID=UPI003A90D49D